MAEITTHYSAITSREGQLVFVGAITPHDPSSGRLITSVSELPNEAQAARSGRVLVDIQMDRAAAQAWTVYSTLSQILASEGSSLSNMLRQRLFLTDLRDLPAVERVMDIFMPEAKPATTILQIPSQGLDPDLVLQLDGVALAERAGGLQKQTINIPPLAEATESYPQATRAGQFIFISNTYGVSPQTGRIARNLVELGSDAALFANHRFHSAQEESICTQTWFAFQNIAATLESQGASLADILKVNGWLAFDMRGYGHSSLAREALFTEASATPASSGLSISGVGKDGADLAFDAIALAPSGGEGYNKIVKLESHRIVTSYVGVVEGGPLVLTCGEVPIDIEPEWPKSVTRFEDLEDSGRFLPFGRIDEPAHFQARAWFVYQKLATYLKLHGSSFKDVLHQTIYLCRPAEYANVERVATLFYGPKLPPTTVIPIVDTSPFPEALLEIELIARKGDENNG